MVSPSRIVVALLLMLLASSSWAVNLQASLDSDEVAAGDTVNLTVTVDEQVFNKSPDFSPLKQNFEILSNRQSSQYSMINGQITSSTNWVLTLLPKSQGYLAIPPLHYGDQTTKALKLHVTPQRQVNPSKTQDVIFLDAQVDQKDVYVQQQIIYTVRLYRRIDLHDSSYTPPKVDNAVMEPLGNQREYNSTVNGRGYKIVELRYVIFPQKSGDLVIPPAEIVGTVFQNSNSFMFDPFNGRQIRRLSPQITVHVKPQPDNYPADKPWLPAQSLTLKEDWSPDGNTFKVGDPVTRHITIEADGLAPSVLPPIKAPSFSNIKVYPDQPDTQSHIGAHGMLSTRTESEAMIATATGKATIPPVEVTWFDVNENRVKTAVLPGRTVTITGTAAPAQTDANIQAPKAPSGAEAAPAPLDAQPTGHNTWRWIAAALVILWLATLAVVVILLRRRRQMPAGAESSKPQSPFSRSGEKAARDSFRAACNANDPKTARSHLLELYRQTYQEPEIHNLNDVLAQTPDDNLRQQLRELDTLLYRTKSGNDGWQGTALIKAVEEAMKKRAAESNQPQSHLEPLFPT